MKAPKTTLYSRFGLALLCVVCCVAQAQTNPSETVTLCYSGTVTNVAVAPPPFPGGPPNTAPFAVGSAFYYLVRINRSVFSQSTPNLRQYLIQGGGMTAAANIGGRGYSFIDGNFNINNGTTADGISSDVMATAQPFPASNTLAFLLSITYDTNPWSTAAITLPTDLPPVSQASFKTFASRFGLNAWGNFSGVIEGESCGPLQLGIATKNEDLSPAYPGQSYADQLDATGGTAPYIWVKQSGALPPGLTLLSNGAITGVVDYQLATDTSYTFTAQVTTNGGQQATKTLTMQVIQPPMTLNITRNGNGRVTSPVGIDCGWTCSVTLPRGSTFLLTASWESGYRFDGWSSGCVSTINGCTVLLDSNKEITATFSRTGSSVTLTFGPINLAIISKTGVQSLRNWTINIANGGTGDLNLLQLTRFQLTQTGGAACAPVMLLPLPADVPDLAAGRSTDFQVPINFTGCAGNARFTLDMTVARQGTAPARAIKLLNQFQ